MAAEDIRHRGGGHKVLLAQPQELALGVVVVGVQNLADDLGVALLAKGPQVVPLVKQIHIDAGALGLPEAQQAYRLGIIAGNIHIIRHGQDGGIAGVVHHMMDAVPALLYPSAKVDFHGMLRHRLQPDLAAGEPVIRQLALPAVGDLLLKDAVLKQDAVAGGGIAIGSQAVQVAGGKASQAAVAQAGVGLALIQILQLNAIGLEDLFKDIHQAQVIEGIFQAFPH